MGFYFNNQNKIINLNGKKYIINLAKNLISDAIFLADINGAAIYDSRGYSLMTSPKTNIIKENFILCDINNQILCDKNEFTLMV